MKKSYISRKDSIILSAIEIIDELGIQKLTTKEIAKRQEITEAAIYKHFRSKNEIILGVLDKFSQFDSSIARAVQERKLDIKESILFVIKSCAEYYENYPAITAIFFIYDIIRPEKEVALRMKEILNGRYNFMTELARRGIENNELCNSISPEDYADIFLGMTQSMVFRWRINDFEFNLKDRISYAVQSFLNYK